MLHLELSDSFGKYFADFYQYIKFALEKTNEPDLNKAAIGSLADISRATAGKFSTCLQEIIPGFINCLKVYFFFL